MDENKRKETLLKRYSSSHTFPQMQKGPQMRGAGPRGGRFSPKSKPKDTLNSVKRLLSYIGEDKKKILFAFLCVLLTTISTLLSAYMLRPIINNYIIPGNLKGLFYALLVMAMVYLVGVASSYVQSRIMIGISQRTLFKIRNDLFKKVQKLPVKFFDTHPKGDIMSRFTNDVDIIGEMLNHTIINLFSGVITIIGTLTIMIYTNWILSLITLVMVPLFVKVASMLSKYARKFFSAQQSRLGAINGFIEETVSGQKVIKLFNHEQANIEDFNILNKELLEKQTKAQFIASMMGPVMGNLSQVNYSITATFAGVMCLLRGFDVGGLTVFVNYSRQFSRPINEISMQITNIFSALSGAERVFEVMDEKEETDDKTKKEFDLSIGEVKLQNVYFGYDKDKTILKDINVSAKKGEKIAFVGSTGAGKTTITNLINRFYDIDKGEILLDGKNINNYTKKSLRKNIAMVLQDTHLFTGTIMDNIRYSRPDATDEEVINASKSACAHSFIKKLKDGYNTILEGDGANLSQGQRQLLNIARAALSKAPILVLDEATSSVDTRTEKLIEKGIESLMKERTTFIIAHRLSTIRNADRIMVLENGEVIEEGTHEELLQKEGRYYSLYTGKIELN